MWRKKGSEIMATETLPRAACFMDRQIGQFSELDVLIIIFRDVKSEAQISLITCPHITELI